MEDGIRSATNLVIFSPYEDSNPWLRDLYGFEFEVAVDDIDGTLHHPVSASPHGPGWPGKMLRRS